MVERLKRLTIPAGAKNANVNEDCFAACAEAQKAVSSQNANLLLEQWQQFDDSEAVINELLAETVDESESNEIADLVDVNSCDEESEITEEEEPTSHFAKVFTAATKAMDECRSVSLESMSWQKAKPILSSMVAPTLLLIRTLQKVPPGLLGEAHRFEKKLLNGSLPKRKQPKIHSLFKKRSRRETAMALFETDQEPEGIHSLL